MASQKDVLQYAARLSSISKGKSLNERDGFTLFNFDRKHCEIVSGGLFATCCLLIPVDEEQNPFNIEIKNEMLSLIAGEFRDVETLTVSPNVNASPEPSKSETTPEIASNIVFSFDTGVISIPNRYTWTGFRFEYHRPEFCEIDQSSALGILSAVPRLLSSQDESANLSAMRLSTENESLVCQSTDKKIAVRLKVPCKGSIAPILLPFAAVPVIRWAVNEFGEYDSFKIGMAGNEIVVKCGPFQAVVKQVDLRFPNVDTVFDFARKKSDSQVTFDTKSFTATATQAKKMGYEDCRIILDPLKPRVEAGSVDLKDSFSIDLDCNVERGSKFRLSSDYVTTATNCMSKLALQEFVMEYTADNSRNPVLMSARREAMSVDVAIAPMDWEI